MNGRNKKFYTRSYEYLDSFQKIGKKIIAKTTAKI